MTVETTDDGSVARLLIAGELATRETLLQLRVVDALELDVCGTVSLGDELPGFLTAAGRDRHGRLALSELPDLDLLAQLRSRKLSHVHPAVRPWAERLQQLDAEDYQQLERTAEVWLAAPVLLLSRPDLAAPPAAPDLAWPDEQPGAFVPPEDIEWPAAPGLPLSVDPLRSSPAGDVR